MIYGKDWKHARDLIREVIIAGHELLKRTDDLNGPLTPEEWRSKWKEEEGREMDHIVTDLAHYFNLFMNEFMVLTTEKGRTND